MATQVQDKLSAILERYREERAPLIMVLQDLQAEEGYLPGEALGTVSQELEVPLSRIYGVATFYKAFSLQPRGRHTIQLCLGTCCHVRGGQRLLTLLKHRLGIEEGQTTEDRRFTLETVRCMGACSLAPTMRIDSDTHGRLAPERLAKILERYP
jgi:NADH-quinone oxidoreductase subunit E